METSPVTLVVVWQHHGHHYSHSDVITRIKPLERRRLQTDIGHLGKWILDLIEMTFELVESWKVGEVIGI